MTIDASGATALVEGLADRGGMVIGDERTAHGGAGSYAHHDPSTGRLQAHVPLGDAADVDQAVAAARAALPGWRALSLRRRADALHRLADLLIEHNDEAAAINALDNGTPERAWTPASWVRYYAGWVDKVEGQVVPSHGLPGLANVIFPDADLDRAVTASAFLGVTLLSGQGCALPTRLYVHDDVYDEVVDRVVAQVEATPVGPTLHTADVGRAHRLATRFEVGSVVVYGFPPGSPTAPFGGVKQSGFGREGGRAGLEEMLRPKNVFIGW